MKNLIKPYLKDSEFDKEPEYFGDSKWVAGAYVDIGDLNVQNKKPNSLFNRKKEQTNSFNCPFTFFVCSAEFKNEPTEIYAKYVDTMLVQKKYDPALAGKWLLNRVNSMGEVTISELTEELHEFLETEEWDFDLEMANNAKSKKSIIQKIGSYFRK